MQSTQQRSSRAAEGLTSLALCVCLLQPLCCCVCCIQLLPRFPGRDTDTQLQRPGPAAVSVCSDHPRPAAPAAACMHVLLFPACVVEQSSCRCCLMLQEVNKLRTQFNQSLDELEQVYQKTQQSLSKIKGRFRGRDL